MALTVIFPSSIPLINPVDELARFFLEEQGVREEDQFWLVAAIHELLANAVVHGNQQDSSKQVIMKMTLLGSKVVVQVQDEGKAKGLTFPKSLSKDSIVKTHGRGLYIVSSIADDVKASPTCRGLCVEMTKRLRR